jgi:hypothetical protein
VQNKTRKLFRCMMLSILIYDCVYNEMLLFYLKVIIQMVVIFVFCLSVICTKRLYDGKCLY